MLKFFHIDYKIDDIKLFNKLYIMGNDVERKINK
jgi:hypothetical protein